jgi:hypothetical protein
MPSGPFFFAEKNGKDAERFAKTKTNTPNARTRKFLFLKKIETLESRFPEAQKAITGERGLDAF